MGPPDKRMPPGPGEEGGTATDSNKEERSVYRVVFAHWQDVCRQQRVQHLYDSGPRVVYEALLEVARGATLDCVLARFARIPAETYRALGADQFPLPPVRVFRRAP